MDDRPPRSFLWAYITLLAVSLAAVGFGVYFFWKNNDARLLGAGALGTIFVCATWPIARSIFKLREDVRRTMAQQLTPVNDTLDQMTVLLNLISEQQLLTERAKTIAFREKERDTLRRAIQEEIARQDWEAALALANEIEAGFGYKSEADRFRMEISHRRSDIVRRQINDAVAGIDRHMRGENWAAANREAERLMQLFPADEQVQRLPQDIEARKQQHKRQLNGSFLESFERKDWDGAMEILKRLDFYLTPTEAESIQDKARVVFKEKLNNLRTQFQACVQEEKWRDAQVIADEVIRDYPNTQMAREMRDLSETIRQRADGITPPEVARVELFAYDPHVIPRANIAIVGAGPAGCTAAAILARHGFSVTILEQHRFPRDKVCGECLSAVGIEVLRETGAHESIARLGAVPLHRVLVHSTDGATLSMSLPSPMLGVSRLAMDSALLDHARVCGATVRERARCEGVSSEAVPIVSVRDLDRNVVEPVNADYVLLAEGKADWVAPQNRPRPTGDMGIKAHFTDVDGPRDAIELFGADGFYGGLAPIENDAWNIAFSIPARHLRRGDVATEFARVVKQNRTLAKRLMGATRTTTWLASPLPRFAAITEFDWPRRVIPIGNAAAALEPIGGEGMGLAMRSASLAAHAIIEAVSSGREVNRPALRDQFVRLWRVRRLGCRAAAMLVSRPNLCDWLVRSIGGTESVPHACMRMIGKS